MALSVIIACLDSANTLADQLEALAGQSCPVGWELLVCDNGSVDDTRGVALRYADRLPLRVVDASAHPGAGAARNAGADAARGPWLAFCDADDVVAPDWLAAMVAALRRHRFVAGRLEGERLNGRRALRSRALDQQDGLQWSGVIDLPHAGAGNIGIHRDLFRRVGGFDPSIACLEDTDLSWRVQLVAGVPLQYSPDVVVHVRLRSAFSDMYRQGRSYGVAHAVLEWRYGHCDGPRTAGGAAVVPASRRLISIASAWLGAPPSAGRLVWQIGWHRGHRRQGAELRVRGGAPEPLRGRDSRHDADVASSPSTPSVRQSYDSR